MKVELHLYATLRKYLPDALANNSVVEARAGDTVAELLDRLEIPMTEVKLVFVDGVQAAMDQELSSGSRVGVFPPVGGG